MSIELRPISPDEFRAFNLATSAAFGDQAPDEDIERLRPIFEFDRSLAAIDGGKIVGTGVLFTFELTLPGRQTVPAGGVSWIGVLPTHRRRGILTSIMRQQLRDVRDRGEPVAILYASESVIYGRYGYGIATQGLQIEISPRHASFGRSLAPAGQVRFLDNEEARAAAPEVYDRYRMLHPGEITRNSAVWDLHFSDPEKWRDGASPRFYVGYESTDGRLDGYVAYRVKEKWEHGFPDNSLRVNDLIWTTDEAHAALWRYLLSIDLISKVTASAPVDEPLRWMLAEPRRLRVTDFDDSLWARLVDIPAALSARRYLAAGKLVLAVTDPFCPENDGRYELVGGPDGAECRATTDEPDLALQVADLGAAFLGGVRFSTLARAGRVEAYSDHALERADAMFGAERAPWGQTGF